MHSQSFCYEQLNPVSPKSVVKTSNFKIMSFALIISSAIISYTHVVINPNKKGNMMSHTLGP